MREIFKQFSKHWGIHEDIVEVIYHLIDDNGVKYTKTSKILFQFNVEICPRQLKYFYRKVKLTQRYGDKESIGKKNYIRLVERSS